MQTPIIIVVAQDEPAFVSPEKASELLGVGVRTIRGLLKRKDNPLPHTRIGSDYRVDTEKMREFIRDEFPPRN